MGNSICHSNSIYKSMLELGLPGHFRRVVLTHIMAILISVFVRGYRGKTVQVSASSRARERRSRIFSTPGSGTTRNWRDYIRRRSSVESGRSQGKADSQSGALRTIHRFKDQALVTGFASNRSGGFPLLSSEKKTGLRTSGRGNAVDLQRPDALLRFRLVRQNPFQNRNYA